VSSQPSPLGRYQESDAREAQPRDVCLVGVPVQVLLAARQHHDDLMREFAVLAVAEHDPRASVPRRLEELVDALGVHYGAAAERPDGPTDEAARQGLRTMDLTFRVPPSVVEAANRLEALMSEADEFCRTEQMLTLPRNELLQQFSRWYLDEFRRQVAGLPPRPWTGPLAP
jgi:hypothetical protein